MNSSRLVTFNLLIYQKKLTAKALSTNFLDCLFKNTNPYMFKQRYQIDINRSCTLKQCFAVYSMSSKATDAIQL